MFHLSAAQNNFLLKFQSDITFVDVAVEIIRHVLEHQKIADPTNILLVARELLKNAVVHGNQNDRDKKVVLRLLRIGPNRYRLQVEDSGPGLGLKKSSISKREREQTDKRKGASGHGFAIINNLSKQVFFNEKGNRITVLLSA